MKKEGESLGKAVLHRIAQTTGNSYLMCCSDKQFCTIFIIFQVLQLQYLKQNQADFFTEASTVTFQI